jgi:hypothetical protein
MAESETDNFFTNVAHLQLFTFTNVAHLQMLHSYNCCTFTNVALLLMLHFY